MKISAQVPINHTGLELISLDENISENIHSTAFDPRVNFMFIRKASVIEIVSIQKILSRTIEEEDFKSF